MIHVLDSEQAVLGAALYDADTRAELLQIVRPEHFHEPVHGLIWEALRGDGPVDPVLVSRKLKDVPAYVEIGGMRYLCDLVDRAFILTAPGHADAVVDAALRRNLRQAGQALTLDAETEGAGEALLAATERALADMARDGSSGPTALPAGMAALDSFDAAARGEYRGAETGVQALDHVTGGIKRDDVWVFGGRSSMGKSVVGVSLGRSIAAQGRGVLMFSLEMPMREVQARLIADAAHYPDASQQVRYGDVLNGRVPHQLHDRARAAARGLASLPFLVIDRGSFTIEDIRRHALRQVRGWERAGIEPGAILIDHLGLVQPVRKTDSKAADTSDTVNELKGIAKQAGCPIIALAQVNRGPENRSDHRPTMGDLNWSGSIEQIADFVCLLYRESYYLARSGRDSDIDRAFACEHEMELLIQKNRSGPICTKKAWVDVACNVLRDAPQGWAA